MKGTVGVAMWVSVPRLGSFKASLESLSTGVVESLDLVVRGTAGAGAANEGPAVASTTAVRTKEERIFVSCTVDLGNVKVRRT